MKRSRYGCRKERSALERYLDSTTETIERLAFERHLDTCQDCRRAVRFEQDLEEALHRGVGAGFDIEFESRILEGVRRTLADPETAHRSATEPASRRVAAILVAAAGVVLACLFARSRTSVPDSMVAKSGETVLEARSVPGESVDVDRLAAARTQIRSALLLANASDSFADVFTKEVASLVADRWPIHELVRFSIDDADPAVAAAAIRGVVELRVPSALPALRRAAHRAPTAGPALIALGALGDAAALPQLERALADRSLAPAAAQSLRLVGSGDAAAALARSLDDPASTEEVVTALLGMGDSGIRELLRRAERGDLVARDALASHHLPTAEQIAGILRSSRDDELLEAAIRRAPAFGDAALAPLLTAVALPSHRESALRSIVTIGSEKALASLLAAPARRSIGIDEANAAACRLLFGFLDPTAAAIRALASKDTSEPLVAALLSGGDAEYAILEQIVGAEQIPLETRIDCAFALAGRDRLDPSIILALTARAATTGDAVLASRALVAAMRIDAPLSGSTAESAAKDPASFFIARQRAGQLATRWKREGSPPSPLETLDLAKRLQKALPEP